MSGTPWYKHYPSDFLRGTSRLSAEETGCYIVCLDLMYERGGPIEDDLKWLAQQCKVPLQRWKKIRLSLIKAEKLNLTDDGRLANGRATYEMHRSKVIAAAQSERGKLGGRPKASDHQPAVEAGPPTKSQESCKEVEGKLPFFEPKLADISDIAKAGEKPLRDSETQKEERKEEKKETSLCSAKKETRRQSSRISADWRPNRQGYAFAEQRGVDIGIEGPRFMNHHQAKGTLMLDWDAAWRTWCLNAVKFGSATGKPLKRENNGFKFTPMAGGLS